MIGAEGFQEGVELGTVVHVAQMAELMDYDVIYAGSRSSYQSP